MIWNPFINAVYDSISALLLDFDGNIEIPENIFSVARDVFGIRGYFFPVRALFPIIVFSFGLATIRLGFAIFRFIKGLIPTMGG